MSAFPICPENQWARDSAHPNCQCCGTSFGMFTRVHHCRSCGKCVCDACSPNRCLLVNGQTDRVCNLCIAQRQASSLMSGGPQRGGGPQPQQQQRQPVAPAPMVPPPQPAGQFSYQPPAGGASYSGGAPAYGATPSGYPPQQYAQPAAPYSPAPMTYQPSGGYPPPQQQPYPASQQPAYAPQQQGGYPAGGYGAQPGMYGGGGSPYGGAPAPYSQPPPQAQYPAGQPAAQFAANPYAAGGLTPEVEAAVRRFQMENEINPIFIPSLLRLAAFDVVIVADDSGSMSGPADPMFPMISRWQELIQSLQLVLRATAAFGKAVDVYFINRGTYRNVQAWEQLAPAFSSPPSGGTNTVRVLDQIWRERRIGPDLGRPLIVHLFTDGHPTNDSWNEDMQGFERWMRNRPGLSRTYFSILLCTDEEEVCNMYRPLEYRCPGVNGWVGAVTGVPGVDVTEDYRGELRDVQALRGPRFRFTMGDYIVKCLVGAIDPAVHSVDLPAGTSVYLRAAVGMGGWGGPRW